MKSINPYLTYDGDAESAFKLYESVFGTQISEIKRVKDMPADSPLFGGDENKIVHVRLPIGNDMTLMGSDFLNTQNQTFIKGNNIHISLDTNSEEAAAKIFNDLSENGTVNMPIGKTFWNSYFGMCVDPFGIQWMVSYSYEDEITAP